jgi:RNA polymerase sigma-70 factor (ECF subfamily)
MVSSAQHDPSEFAALYDRYFRQIYHYLYGRVGNAAEAEDLTAQTFLAALKALPRYHHHGHFAAWLFAIARNKTMDFYRNAASHTPLDENHPDESDDPLSQAIRTDQIKQLAGLVSTLDENSRNSYACDV